MRKRKSVVLENDPGDSFNLFRDNLVPSVTDVRGRTIAVDFGDYIHGVVDHPHMASRIGWIVETLKNPEQIRRHWDRRLRHREVYVNTIYESDEDPEGHLHLVLIDTRWDPPKFWTTFVPQNRWRYLRLIEEGEVLWKPGR